jgi:hypothetical protein
MSKQFRKANHDSLWVRELEVAFPPFGILRFGGRKAFSSKIPVEGVYAANAENHAIPRIAGAGGRLAKVDDTLAGTHGCEGSIGSAVRDVEPKLLIEGHRFNHIQHGQGHATDVVDPPRWHKRYVDMCSGMRGRECWDRVEQVGESGYRGMGRPWPGHLEAEPFSDVNKRHVLDAKARSIKRADLVWRVALTEPEIAHNEQDNNNDSDDRKDVIHLVPPMPARTRITSFDSRQIPNRRNDADARTFASFVTSALQTLVAVTRSA